MTREGKLRQQIRAYLRNHLGFTLNENRFNEKPIELTSKLGNSLEVENWQNLKVLARSLGFRERG